MAAEELRRARSGFAATLAGAKASGPKKKFHGTAEL
jgi:hypothetical protein